MTRIVLACMALAGCSPDAPPVDIAGVRVVLLCGIGCPVGVTLADEGTATPTEPAKLTEHSAGALTGIAR